LASEGTIQYLKEKQRKDKKGQKRVGIWKKANILRYSPVIFLQWLMKKRASLEPEYVAYD
jgi:plasmid rolling circle replication initiator protein Rep